MLTPADMFHSWAFPRSAVRELAERAGRMLPEHIDFLDKVVFRCG